jgi:hypothetical protein
MDTELTPTTEWRDFMADGWMQQEFQDGKPTGLFRVYWNRAPARFRPKEAPDYQEIRGQLVNGDWRICMPESA